MMHDRDGFCEDKHADYDRRISAVLHVWTLEIEFYGTCEYIYCVCLVKMLTTKYDTFVILALVVSATALIMIMKMYPVRDTVMMVHEVPSIVHETNNILSKPTNIHTKAPQNWTWNALFSYVPYAVEDCKTLFNGTGKHTLEFSAKYKEFVAEVRKIHLNDGSIVSYKEEFFAYIEAAQAPFVRTVCETGFNAGHSTFVWLAANPKTHVYSFDLGSHTYGRPMAQYLMDRFPGRLHMTWGNSVQTLHKFREEHPDVKCDLMVIDEGHFYDVCKSDLYNFRQMANPDNILIMDDYPNIIWGAPPKLDRCWDEAKRNAEIAEIYNFHFHPLQRGYAVGRIIVDRY